MSTDMRFTLTESETEELVELSNRLSLLRSESLEVMTEGNDDKIRDLFRGVMKLSEDLNELYKRTIVAQMLEFTGDQLGRCVGYHFQMTEAIAVTMAQLCMSDEEKAALLAPPETDKPVDPAEVH